MVGHWGIPSGQPEPDPQREGGGRNRKEVMGGWWGYQREALSTCLHTPIETAFSYSAKHMLSLADV